MNFKRVAFSSKVVDLFNTAELVQHVVTPLAWKDSSAPTTRGHETVTVFAAVPVKRVFLGFSRNILRRRREIRNSSA